jgi:hypothetical protein
MEAELQGSISNRQLMGRIDCLAARADGGEAVIDVKYGGVRFYPELLEDGRAVQLAVYAESRHQATGRWPAVAYLILRDSRLVTPEGAALAGARPASVVRGPGMEQVWERFARALDAGEGWTAPGRAIPVRPAQKTTERSPDADIVIEAPQLGQIQADVSPCTFCDLDRLCGIAGAG